MPWNGRSKDTIADGAALDALWHHWASAKGKRTEKWTTTNVPHIANGDMM